MAAAAAEQASVLVSSLTEPQDSSSSSMKTKNDSEISHVSNNPVVVYDQSVLQRTIKGVVFDMDGTLTVPVIDFQYMRQVVRAHGQSEACTMPRLYSAQYQHVPPADLPPNE